MREAGVFSFKFGMMKGHLGLRVSGFSVEE